MAKRIVNMLHLFKHFIDSFLLRIMFFKLNDIGLFCLETVTFPGLDRGNEILSLVSQTSSRCETIFISLLMAFILVIVVLLLSCVFVWLAAPRKFRGR